MSGNSEKNLELKVGYPKLDSPTEYDTASIQSVSQAILLDNLFSPLIEFDHQGNVTSGVSSDFKWDGESFLFNFNKDIRTFSGHKITADDAAFSLKRLLIKASNTHGDLKHFLCRDEDLKDLSSACKGIQVKDNVLVLTPFEKKRREFLLHLLASTDCAIVPKTAVDIHQGALPIVNYRETSGAYYIESYDSLNRRLILRPNKIHYHFTKSIPQYVEMIESDGSQAESDFENGKIDLITTAATYLSSAKLRKLKTTRDNAQLGETLPIKALALFTSKKGISELSREERLAIGQAIRSRLLNNPVVNDGSLERTNEFFPTLGDAGLGSEKTKELERLLDSARTSVKLQKEIVISLPKRKIDSYKAALADLPWVKIVEMQYLPWIQESGQSAHFYVLNGDVAFQEDFTLLSYYMQTGLFGYSKTIAANLMKEYLDADDKLKRLEIIKKIHFDILASGTVIPVGIEPCSVLVAPGWTLKMTRLFANTNLWDIHRSP